MRAQVSLAAQEFASAEALLGAGRSGRGAGGAQSLELVAAHIAAGELNAQSALIALQPQPHEAAHGSVRDPFGLTPREREVLEVLAEGATNNEIAERLCISVKTAGIHVSHILAKLHAANRTAAATLAHRAGLVREGAVSPPPRPSP